MGKYYKAYPINKIREFSQWGERTENTRKEKKEIDGKEVKVHQELSNDDFLYVQENYVLIDGIYKDENIIFDKITPEWKNFCDRTVGFELSLYASVEK